MDSGGGFFDPYVNPYRGVTMAVRRAGQKCRLYSESLSTTNWSLLDSLAESPLVLFVFFLKDSAGDAACCDSGSDLSPQANVGSSGSHIAGKQVGRI